MSKGICPNKSLTVRLLRPFLLTLLAGLRPFDLEAEGFGLGQVGMLSNQAEKEEPNQLRPAAVHRVPSLESSRHTTLC